MEETKENEPLFIADSARIVGDVRIENNVNIWYGAVLRGDVTFIKIGKSTNIQDNTVIHVDHNLPSIIGANVTIGHSAIIHGAKIDSFCLIGMGAIVLSGAEIGGGSIIGAGTLVKENERIPPFSLVVGIPGKIVRKLDESIIADIRQSAEEYIELAKRRIDEDS